MAQNIRIIAGKYKNHNLFFSPQAGLRPTTHRLRETVFNILVHRFYSNSIGCCSKDQFLGLEALDAFAGIGSYGFEALSRGANHVTFVESSFKTAEHLHNFAKKLNRTADITVLSKAIQDTVDSLGHFDVIFIDPPYDFSQEELKLVLLKLRILLKPDGIMVLEFPKNLSFNTMEMAFQRKISNTMITFLR